MVFCFVRNLLLRIVEFFRAISNGMEFITIGGRSDISLYDFGF